MRISMVALVALVALASCNDEGTVLPEPPAAKVFQIHLQGGFSHTPVSVTVDHQSVFADTVTSNLSLSLAAIIPVQVNQGTHTLNVTVPDTISQDTTFTIADTLYIGVNYSSTSRRLDFRFQGERFYYR